MIAVSGKAQILDDTTELVYGPSTTRYQLKEDIFNDKDTVFRSIDTTSYGFHNFSPTYKNITERQDLGNLGTASKAVYYKVPEKIGVNLGLDAFNPYFIYPAQFRYFNTKSPYSDLSYIQGGGGQNILNAEFSANIKPNLNFGFGYNRLSSNKFLGAITVRDRQTDHLTVKFNLGFYTKNERYRILTSFIHYRNKTFELGGIAPGAGETKADFFDYEEEAVRLPGAFAEETRTQFHFYQQFRLAKRGLALFHTADIYRQIDYFNDDSLISDFSFYPRITKDSAFTTQSLTYHRIENTLGVKGAFKFADYKFWYRIKNYKFKPIVQDSLIETDWRIENFVGGELSGFINERVKLTFRGEYFLGKDYDLGVFAEYKFLHAEARRTAYSPTLIQQQFFNNHADWNNDFKLTTADVIKASADFKIGRTRINPFGELANVSDYIYFDTVAEPVQTAEPVRMISGGLTVKTHISKLFIELSGRYTGVFGPDVIRVPQFSGFSRIYYENKIFKKALFIQLGADVRWNSSYFADNYQPAYGQFHLQDDFLIDSYPVADVFVNALIKRIKVFVKVSNINKGWPADGYFTTPFYTGLNRSFGFGFAWSFYD